jgi:hypothetical protein
MPKCDKYHAKWKGDMAKCSKYHAKNMQNGRGTWPNVANMIQNAK